LISSKREALLQEVPAVYNTQINDVLLTALVQTFARWTGEPCLLIDLEGQGREEIARVLTSPAQSAGSTTVFPVLLKLRQPDDPGPALKSVKEQLRGYQDAVSAMDCCANLAEDAETEKSLRELPQAEVCFNYLGQWDQVLSESSSLVPRRNRPARRVGGDGHVVTYMMSVPVLSTVS